MTEEKQNILYEKFPKIFRQKDLSMQQTAMCWGISCGDGWFNILYTLCSHIQHLVEDPHEQIKMYKDWIEKESLLPKEEQREDWTERCKEYIEAERAKIIPQIEAVQVKEKYGTLRFYIQGYPKNPVIDAKLNAYIDFAENMSAITCEICGRPGKLNSDGWATVRCESCN